MQKFIESFLPPPLLSDNDNNSSSDNVKKKLFKMFTMTAMTWILTMHFVWIEM